MTTEHADGRFYEQHALLCVVVLSILLAAVFALPHLPRLLDLSAALR